MAKTSIVKAIKDQCKVKTAAIVLGDVYFLSSFHDQCGAFVKVLSKNTKLNTCGWPSNVEVEVVENFNPDTPFAVKHYAPGTKHSVNASNLYKNREDASHRAKFPSFYK